MNVGDRMRLRRIELGLSQIELGKKLNCSKSYICRLERNDINMTTSTVSKIAKALDATESYLMGWSDSTTKDISEEVDTDLLAWVGSDPARMSMVRNIKKLNKENFDELIEHIEYLTFKQNKKD